MSIIRVVLQARMGSKRRPGKTMADIAGRPLLQRCLERLNEACRRGGSAWQLVVATSTLPDDDRIADLVDHLGYACIRGSEENVLSRFILATKDLQDDDLVVRATADNPLYCGERTVAIVTRHRLDRNDYTGIDPLSPSVPEVVRVGALRAASIATDLDDYCCEHVTPFFRRENATARCRRLAPTWNGLDPTVRLTVDTPEDVAAMDCLYHKLITETGEDRPGLWTLEQIYRTAGQLQESAATPDRLTNV